jgi:hypothetical protein
MFPAKTSQKLAVKLPQVPVHKPILVDAKSFPLKVISKFVPVAVNEYHPSSAGLAMFPPGAPAPLLQPNIDKYGVATVSAVLSKGTVTGAPSPPLGPPQAVGAGKTPIGVALEQSSPCAFALEIIVNEIIINENIFFNITLVLRFFF